MREFETLKAYIPPLNISPGSEYPGTTIGSGGIGQDYNINFDGWTGRVNDPGKVTGTPAQYVSGPWYQFLGYHRSRIEWSPWARSDIAMTPIAQDVVEGKVFSAFHTPWPEVTTTNTDNPTIPAWSGADCKVLDIWSSEEIEEEMLENLAWNGDLPGAEARYPVSTYSALYYPKNNPSGIEHKLRFDQVISARYRQMVSSDNAPSSQYWGGEFMTINDVTIGGNASMSDTIHHARYVILTVSNDGLHNIASPAIGGIYLYNYLKWGIFIPSAYDTLTVGLNKVESDAEWATLARRGASR